MNIAVVPLIFLTFDTRASNPNDHKAHPSKYVNNQVREISLDTLNSLCKALSCRAGDLIEYVAENKSSSRK
jgi:hypothetical protein